MSTQTETSGSPMIANRSEFPRYDWRRSYDWNYENAPSIADVEVAAVPGDWRFCGLKVDSPLGVPAGPLLNSSWVLYYASLGFDVVTYKTVRSAYRACYPLPNLQPVRCGPISGTESRLPTSETMLGSWAVSFGMPSKAPEIWRADVEFARSKLPTNKILCVSVVGSVESGWTIDDLARDYANCSRWAVEAGADAVEVNFSCPNVSTCDGQLYQDHPAARIVAQCVREAIGMKPLILKIGRVLSEEDAERLIDAVSDSADGLAMTNSIASTVVSADGNLLFEGQKRGICGAATRAASVDQIRCFARLLADRNLASPTLIGVGGASTVDDVRSFLKAGAQSVHIATAAMVQPDIGLRIREQMSGGMDARKLKATLDQVSRMRQRE